jgi:prophage DNA circulation protein
MTFIDPLLRPTYGVTTSGSQSQGRTSGGMPMNAWRARLQRASFRGVQFFTEVDGKSGGRRLVPHEYPKSDQGVTEDMGRKLRKHFVVGYVIGENYIQQRENLINACEQKGAGSLVHPLLGREQVECDNYTVSEDQRRGGMAHFEMAFIEAGQEPTGGGASADSSQQGVNDAANNSDTQTANSLDNNVPLPTPRPSSAPQLASSGNGFTTIQGFPGA